MARKGKNKNAKTTRKYNQKQFREVFCSSCAMCRKNANPAFCYAELYRHEPKQFVNHVAVNLMAVRQSYDAGGRLISSISLEQFANMFCITGICHNGSSVKGLECPSKEDCYRLFRSQLGVSGGAIIHDNPADVVAATNTGSGLLAYDNRVAKINARRKRRLKKMRSRLVVQAYPTFFSSQNEKFQETIKAILNGDNDIEQDKGEESAGLHEGKADRSSEN